MIEVFPVRKMCLLSFLLLLLTLPFLVHGSASAQTETLRVMVYDRENMPEEYGSCEDNAWVRLYSKTGWLRPEPSYVT